MNNHTYINLESSKIEYESLSENEWIKIYFNDKNGGYLATHKLKVKDDPGIPGIVAEAQACLELASIGEHVLRLPENIPELIDTIVIDKKPYHELLKFKPGESNPRGYPDAYFNGQTWDFKTSTFKNEITLRHRIKDARKADNVIFITTKPEHLKTLEKVINREIGTRKKNNSWKELPNVYAFLQNELLLIWEK